MRAGDARAALNEMALRQNDWTLGAVCARYCGVVAQHHGVEDAAVFPHLALREPQLTPVIDRLTEEHLVIHDAIQEAVGAFTEGAPQSDDITVVVLEFRGNGESPMLRNPEFRADVTQGA
jgi:hypothetical protein